MSIKLPQLNVICSSVLKTKLSALVLQPDSYYSTDLKLTSGVRLLIKTEHKQAGKEFVTKVAMLKRQLEKQAKELEGIRKRCRQLRCDESKVDCYEFMLEHLLYFHISRTAKVFAYCKHIFFT